MRIILGIALLALAALGAISCKDKITSPPVSQLTGTWVATQNEYVSKASPARYDVMGHGGSATLVLEAAHRYLYVEHRAAAALPDSSRGAWSVNEDEMTWTFDQTGWTRSYTVALAGGTLRLTGGDVLYDFGGTLEESDHNLVLARPEVAAAR